MLSKPSPQRVALLTILTLGLYFFYWCAQSKKDIQRSARQQLIPSTWLLAVPAANFWWMWQYSQALESVTYRRIKGNDVFLIYIVALSAWYVGLSSADLFIPDPEVSSEFTRGDLMLLLGIGGGLLIAQIIGLAFFCAVIQRKINRVVPSDNARPLL